MITVSLYHQCKNYPIWVNAKIIKAKKRKILQLTEECKNYNKNPRPLVLTHHRAKKDHTARSKKILKDILVTQFQVNAKYQ